MREEIEFQLLRIANIRGMNVSAAIRGNRAQGAEQVRFQNIEYCAPHVLFRHGFVEERASRVMRGNVHESHVRGIVAGRKEETVKGKDKSRLEQKGPKALGLGARFVKFGGGGLGAGK